MEPAGGFSEKPALRGLEDYDLWLRVAAISEIHYVREELVMYRHSSASLSRCHTRLGRLRSMSLIFERAATARDPSARAAIQEQLDMCRRAICETHLAERHFMDFAKELGGFCGSNPLAAGKYVVSVLGRGLNRFNGKK